MPVAPDVLRTERVTLVDWLETLTPEQWATPSLCPGWTVQDVAAHLAWAPVLSPGRVASGLLRAGLRPNRFTRDSARRWSARGRPAITAQLRTNAATDVGPVGVPRDAVLLDAVVHALDVRRPLRSSRALPPAAFRAAADFSASARWPASVMLGGGAARRVAGVRLVAEDQEWSHGEGPEVRASGEALLLLLSGRPLGSEELRGAGAPEVRRRLEATRGRR
jgi:uncharacterized protein (TIGR03083 family)